MSERSPLDRLAEACRIQPSYVDIWGEHHQVSADTKRALLRAMGYTVDDEASLEAALDARHRRRWQQPLPPAHVVRGQAAPGMPLRLRAADREPIPWRLITEAGHRHSGQAEPASLAQTDHAEIEGQAYVEYWLPLPAIQETGYHRLELGDPSRPWAHSRLIVAPETCYWPPAVQGQRRCWGISAQLYALHSGRNWGIGDFTDLDQLVDCCADFGADTVGLNPLHALFPDRPGHSGPYGPSSRLFLNVLYLDVEAIPEFAESERARRLAHSSVFQQRLQALRARHLVDYEASAAVKREVLEILYATFREHHLERGTARGQAFRDFQRRGGEALHRHTLFEALQAHFQAQEPEMADWRAWPEPYRRPDSQEVAAFADSAREQIEFYQYLQWQACLQLENAAQRAQNEGLGIGLYQDLAVSVDGGGAEVWANQGLYAVGAHIGAPPDDFNLRGQDWGLPPWTPEGLLDTGFQPFIDTLRANMAHAGALRIDHVMGLMRLFWVPAGQDPTAGAYVHYPLEALLGILALESQRNHCLVVGEDLGTVPDTVREAMGPAGLLSYRLLFFERDGLGDFRPPAAYPSQALVSVSTHDLPTLAGYWEGHDLAVRAELGLFPTESQREQQIVQRAHDRARLLVALEHEGLLPAGMHVDPAATPAMGSELAIAIYRYLARAPSKVLLVQLEDLLGQREQVNLPGTTAGHPNWQRKLPRGLEAIHHDPQVQAFVAAVASERGRPRPAAYRGKGAGERWPEATVPRATYRLQLNAGFTFDDAASLVPYLDELGISHGYMSPYLKARPGSTHGYDIVDHTSLNPEVGDRASYERFVAMLHRHGMGQILDIVPNHMGVMGSDNLWWLDVLENGPASVYADYFDIDWHPVKPELHNKLLVPTLGDRYGDVLINGELRLVFDGQAGTFSVWFYEHRFPIDPRCYPVLLRDDIDDLRLRLGPEDPCLVQLESLATAFEHLPPRARTDDEGVAERNRDKELHKARLAELCAECPAIGKQIAETVAGYNGKPGDPDSFTRLHELLEAQPYRLAHWRVAGHEINYRRFFDINDLAGLRQEHEPVFEATHGLIFELVRDHKVDGLRVDHPDGLYDPLQYFRRLRDRATSLRSSVDPPVYIVAEKILADHEHLRAEWPIEGTTGYDFANLLNGLLVDSDSEAEMDRIYAAFTAQGQDFDELLYQCKRRMMRISLTSELNVLANRINRLSEGSWHTRDFTLNGLRDALGEVVACFPVYRTYVTSTGVAEMDRRYVEWAIAQAKKRSADADTSVFDFIRAVLLLESEALDARDNRAALADFTQRFQQYTAALTAKGMEDTAFYRYHRLVSLNEVGGEPRRFGVSVNAFHKVVTEQGRRWPHGLLSTSTHDAKRSEDVRARIDVLSEMPQEWETQVARWSQMNRWRRREVDGGPAPHPNDEYLLYQTLIGSWPPGELDEEALATYRQRIRDYMLKAAREAKTHTAWTNRNSAYEDALCAFVDALLEDGEHNRFLKELLPFQQRVAWLGCLNGLSQTLLKLVAPGVPDIYQGNEVWTFSLVDPDNRRPVDYNYRRRLLTQLREHLDVPTDELPRRVRSLADRPTDDANKLYLTWRTLGLRRHRPALFEQGDYRPLKATGAHCDHLIAAARRHGDGQAIAVAPRLPYRLTAGQLTLPVGELWGDTEVVLDGDLAAPAYENILTGQHVAVTHRQGQAMVATSRVLADFPVALLVPAR